MQRYLGLARTDQLLEASDDFFADTSPVSQAQSEDDWWSGPSPRPQVSPFCQFLCTMLG